MQKLSISQQIGNVVSTLLLGQTKEMIIRTDEGMKHLTKSVDSIKVQLDSMDKRQGLMETELGKVDLRLKHLER